VHFSKYYEVSKEFVEIEKKISVKRTKNRSSNLPYTFFPDSFISFSKIVFHFIGQFRSKDLSDHCSRMVRQAVILTKIGLW